MALTAKSLFLYGFEITPLNRSIDFRTTSGGPILQASLKLGFYSLTTLLAEVRRAMAEADPDHEFISSVDRTYSGGTQNRVSIGTTHTYLDLLFGTGPRVGSSAGPMLGFLAIDRVGATTYQGTSTAGTALIPTEIGYSYTPQELYQKLFGNVNLSSSGVKEAVVFNIQRFEAVTFKWEPYHKAKTEWSTFFAWAIRQRAFEFTPEITLPNIFYNVTLESTPTDGKGLGFKMTEMLPQLPFQFETGLILMRIIEG